MPSRERIKELLPVLQAFAEGKAVQWKDSSVGRWVDFREDSHCSGLGFHNDMEYRVKPEPVKHEVWLNTYFDKNAQLFRCCHHTPYKSEEAARRQGEAAERVLVYLGPIRLEYVEEPE